MTGDIRNFYTFRSKSNESELIGAKLVSNASGIYWIVTYFSEVLGKWVQEEIR